jgi:hypothetical protein
MHARTNVNTNVPPCMRATLKSRTFKKRPGTRKDWKTPVTGTSSPRRGKKQANRQGKNWVSMCCCTHYDDPRIRICRKLSLLKTTTKHKLHDGLCWMLSASKKQTAKKPLALGRIQPGTTSQYVNENVLKTTTGFGHKWYIYIYICIYIYSCLHKAASLKGVKYVGMLVYSACSSAESRYSFMSPGSEEGSYPRPGARAQWIQHAHLDQYIDLSRYLVCTSG